jgi:hypothetical protein
MRKLLLSPASAALLASACNSAALPASTPAGVDCEAEGLPATAEVRDFLDLLHGLGRRRG